MMKAEQETAIAQAKSILQPPVVQWLVTYMLLNSGFPWMRV